METISIIGGGRWAKTIAGVLTALPVGPGRVILHTRHNADQVRAWIADRKLQTRVSADQNLPDYQSVHPLAVIVANHARDHVEVAVPALRAGIPVLVEKPMAVGKDAVQRVCREADGKAVLAASNVFLFARYLESFAEELASAGPVCEIRFDWEDGAGDLVRGDVKSYDPSITVFDDVLPHVAAIVQRIQPQALALTGLDVHRQGGEVALQATAGATIVLLKLARDAAARRRLLTARTPNGAFTLDFTQEPGTIAAPGRNPRDGDPLWNNALRPLGAMLTAFLAAARGAPLDPRLSPLKALTAARLADEVRALSKGL